MPKRLAVEFQCDRCKKFWYEDYDPKKEELPDTASVKLELSVPGKPVLKVDFEVCCESCANTVANYAAGINKSRAKEDGTGEGDGQSTDHHPPPKSPTQPSGEPASFSPPGISGKAKTRSTKG